MLNAKVRDNEDCIVLAGRGAVDRAGGHRGILDLDLNHDLDRSGPARTVKGNPSESGSDFVPQATGDEWVMRRECP